MQQFYNTYLFWGVLIITNIAMYICTIVISYTWSKINNHKTLALSKQDIKNSITVLLINIVIAFPGYYLFKKGVLVFTTEIHFIRDGILLYFIFDVAMYLLHLASHYVWPFKLFHKKHHSHHYFNIISLYVMEPIESLLFGCLLTIFALVCTLNFYSFLSFIFVNWLLGVIGHLNTKSTQQPLLFANHVFHKAHHQHPASNFGFYTVIWDKIFGTIYKSNNHYF